MNKCITKNAHWLLALSGLVFLPGSIIAQEDLDTLDDEEIFELSPFEVSTEGNDGYSANETLGGTRIRTDYRDLATPLTAVTSQFLEDTAATDNQSLLNYTTSTEVGGLYGNYGGLGNGQGIGDRSKLISPNNNTRVRGLDQADNTRNFFLTNIPWDSFNIDRIEIQRGPNSILFGVGSPAGIINATTIVAQMNGNSGKIENRYGQFNSNRVVADYNVEVIDDVFAVRVAGLYNNQKFRQKPAFSTDERLYATATFQKKIIPMDWADDMVIRASYETAQVESNNPRILPPTDGISLWFEDFAGDGVNDPIGFGKRLMDMFLYSTAGGGDPYRGAASESTVNDPFYQPGVSSIDSGDLNNGGIGFFFINGESRPFFTSRQAPRSYPGGLAGDGSVDNAVNSSPYGSPMRVSGFNNYAIQLDKLDEVNGDPSRFPLASRGYYKDKSLTDPTIFDFYNQLIDGDNKREFKEWDATNISLAQTFFNSRLGVEFVYDNQKYEEWRGGATFDRPYISIDINTNLQHQVSKYTRVEDPTGSNTDGLIDRWSYSVPGFTPTADQPYANPMAGAAFMSGGFNTNEKLTVERETSRFTVFGELRASDFLDSESTLAKILGRHIFTGLLTREEKYETRTEWEPSATTYQWASGLSANQDNNIQLGGAERGITSIIYLSDSLVNRGSASGLNLGPIRTYYNPSGTYDVTYFKTEWLPSTNPADANYVDPGAPWNAHYSEGTIDPAAAALQADNPNNYTGWTQAGTDILNADNGDLDQLISNYGVNEQVVDSKGLVWQGYLFDGLIVPTFGWRKDELKTYTATGAEDTTGISSTHAVPTEQVLNNTGETISYGVVAHMPQKIVEKMKFVSGLSAYYNVGENQKVEARYNFDGNPLDNPTAESVDFGAVINLFDDKLTIKVGRFETKVKNGNLSGGTSLIGNNQYYIYNLEAWGTANALMYLFGREGLDPNQSWHWNWANVDSGSGVWDDPATAEFQNHPSTQAQTAAIDAWITNMDAQFFENYQIPADVAGIQSAYSTYKSSGDIQPLIAAAAASGMSVGGYTTSFSSQNNGQINGIAPNGTIDNTSKGWEVEVNYRPTPNWNIQVNASKTDAFRESLGTPMLDFIATQWEKMQGPAGDIRLWWGGDNTLRRNYEDNIISAVKFQEESVGFQVPELRPWKASVISNYSFTGDKFKGFNIGGAFRYQDEQILGYGIKDDLSGLSVDKPIYGDTDSHVDMWVGYERELTDKVDWRIQINMRNLGEDVNLVPISANPDGSFASQRIAEGMSWSVTNTFRF